MAMFDHCSILHRIMSTRYLPIPLPFAPGPFDQREWEIEFLPPPCSLSSSFTGSKLRASLHRILVEAGLAMTPATTYFDPRSWFALYRYRDLFSGTGPLLRLIANADILDPRLTAVFAEEVGAGIASYVLHEHMSVSLISDLYPLLFPPPGKLKEVDFVPGATSGDRPDFYCLTDSGEVVLAESKGAVGTRCAVAPRVDPEGWNQVQNVMPVTRPLRAQGGRVAMGTHFCIAGKHRRSETTTLIRDPDEEERPPAHEPTDFVFRLAYAKILRFAGLDLQADLLLLGQSEADGDQTLWPTRQATIGQMPCAILGPCLFGGLLLLWRPISEALSAAGTEMETRIQRLLPEFRVARQQLPETAYALPNGLVVALTDPADLANQETGTART